MKSKKFRRAIVLFQDNNAGILEEVESGYKFTYNSDFIKTNTQISISLPLKNVLFESPALFPFFKGLLPEGWYLDIVCSTLKIDKNDNFGILLATCKDTAGAVSIKEIE